MEHERMWCSTCARMVAPRVSVNYPMTIGILGVLVAITIVFVWVTLLDRAFGQFETTALTLLVTVLPFGYMRARGMKLNRLICPLCGSADLADSGSVGQVGLHEAPPSVSVSG